MSIIWCGGEDIDFAYKVNPDYSTSTSNRRIAWSRVAIDTVDSNSSIMGSQYFTPVTSCWVHAYYKMFATGAVSGTYSLIYLYDSSTGATIGIGNDGTTGNTKVSLIRYDGSTNTVIAYESGTSWSGFVGTIDFQLINYGASGRVKVWMNGVAVIDYTGDLVGSSGATGLDQLRLYGSSYASHPCGYWSELIVSTTDTRAMGLKTLAPDSAGDANEWTGAYTDVDEIEVSDIDVIYTSAGSKSFQLNLTGMPAGVYSVKGVKVAGRVLDGTGKLDIKAGVKTNSVVHLGDQRGLEPVWVTIEEFFQTNPQTTNDWTTSEIDSLQIAFQSVSTTTTTTTT